MSRPRSNLDRLAQRRSTEPTRLIRRLRRHSLLQQRVQAVDGARVRVDGRWLISFASTNYLGLAQHPSVRQAACRAILPGFTRRRWHFGVSLGAPRLFVTDPLTARLEAKIACLVSQADAVVFTSTTHAALDLLPLLAGRRGALFADARAYPISVDGAKLAAQRGAKLCRFPHNDVAALAQQLRENAQLSSKVVVCDGIYIANGEQARLRQFEALAQSTGATVYVDDAHGLGIWGRSPSRTMPYGIGGGGTPVHQRVPSGNVVHVGSLGKAFGVPLAFAAGPERFVDFVRSRASSHVHSSPPALPVLAAALAALRVHQTQGDQLRRRLLRNVRLFRRGLAGRGLLLAPTLFPIQSLHVDRPDEAIALARDLRRAGIWPVLHLAPLKSPTGAVLRFVLTAAHRRDEIGETTETIFACCRQHNSYSRQIPTLLMKM